MPSDIPSCQLPPVGRHTEVLEQSEKERDKTETEQGPNPYQMAATRKGQDERASRVAVRRPSVVETPELKKAKLEAMSQADERMPLVEGDISPGQPIFGTQEDSLGSDDVDIPEVGRSQVSAEIPVSFPQHVEHVDLTEEDKKLEDELSSATANPDQGAGLKRILGTSDQGCGNPSAFNRALRANLPASTQINNSPPNLPPEAVQASQAKQGRHDQAAANTCPFPQEMPPWLSDIHAGLQSLHNKADRQYADITQGLQVQGLRLTHLEATMSEHSDKHSATDNRLRNIEQKLRDLETLRDDLSRSPRHQQAPRSPRSPRSPRQSNFGGGYRDGFSEDEPDFDLVAGGWSDARRDDAIQETKNILQDAQVQDRIDEVWAPYSRTSFVKIRLHFEPNMTIAAKRRAQKQVIDALKLKKYVSGVPGSENTKIWITRSKTPEERVRTRAIVLCKTFYCKLPHKDPTQSSPFSENTIDIAWNGKVFFGKHQLLGNVHRDGEPSAYDLLLCDSRGNHLDWYIIAKAFETITSRPQEELQAVWDRYGPSSDRPE